MPTPLKTGFRINPRLKKVSDDENEYPLDVNNNRTTGPRPSGLSQDTMENPAYSSTYRVYDPEFCEPGTPIVYNDEQFGWATKDSCGDGFYSLPVKYIVPAGVYQSSSKEAANTLALNDVSVNKQGFANETGECLPDGEVGNEYQSQIFVRNNCTAGGIGSSVPVEVEANTYFASTLAAANAAALAYIAANGQSIANSTGTCPPVAYKAINSNGDAVNITGIVGVFKMRRTISGTDVTLASNTIDVINPATAVANSNAFSPTITSYFAEIEITENTLTNNLLISYLDTDDVTVLGTTIVNAGEIGIFRKFYGAEFTGLAINLKYQIMEDYFLTLNDDTTDPEASFLFASLRNSIGEDVTVSEDLSFDWGALSSPVGGGTGGSVGGPATLLAGTSAVTVLNYSTIDETMSSLGIASVDPTIVDGHNIINA